MHYSTFSLCLNKIFIFQFQTPKGFLLVVEQGILDQALHMGWAVKALRETLELDVTVAATMAALGDDLDDTLVMVTSDHAHTLSISNEAERGSDIRGGKCLIWKFTRQFNLIFV